MAFSHERFNEQLALLTDPELGLVQSTAIPDIYQLPGQFEFRDENTRELVVITGPSGVGKDSILGDMLKKEAQFSQAKTASTRARRPGEAPDAMTWMRSPKPGEVETDYVQNLVDEYGLAEYSLHHGDLYGLPRANLDAIPLEQIPLLNTDTDGIASLQKSLTGQYALTSIIVCPENAAQLEQRLHQTGRHSQGRLDAAQKYLNDASATSNFVLVNREVGTPAEAISGSANKVLALLRSLKIIEYAGR